MKALYNKVNFKVVFWTLFIFASMIYTSLSVIAFILSFVID